MERVDINANGELGAGSVLSVDISADGRFVAFDTLADNLEPGVGDQNGFDVFVRDRTTGITAGISTVGDTGAFDGHCFLSSISANGRFVGFTATDSFDGDTNGFVDDAVVADRQLGTVRIVSRNSAGGQATKARLHSSAPTVSSLSSAREERTSLPAIPTASTTSSVETSFSAPPSDSPGMATLSASLPSEVA